MIEIDTDIILIVNVDCDVIADAIGVVVCAASYNDRIWKANDDFEIIAVDLIFRMQRIPTINNRFNWLRIVQINAFGAAIIMHWIIIHTGNEIRLEVIIKLSLIKNVGEKINKSN